MSGWSDLPVNVINALGKTTTAIATQIKGTPFALRQGISKIYNMRREPKWLKRGAIVVKKI